MDGAAPYRFYSGWIEQADADGVGHLGSLGNIRVLDAEVEGSYAGTFLDMISLGKMLDCLIVT